MKYYTMIIQLFLFLFLLTSFPYQLNIVSAIQVGKPNSGSVNPFNTKEGAPQIVMEYKNKVYQGELRSFIFSSGNANDNMPSFENNRSKVTSIIPQNSLNVSKNSQIQLLIKGNPLPELQPNSLSATAYHTNGTEVKVLSTIEDTKKDKFIADLPKGEYLIITTATWLPNSNNYNLFYLYLMKE